MSTETKLGDLRDLPPMPGLHATPQELVDYLLDVRRRQDRVEEILGRAMRNKANVQRRHDAVVAEAEEAWDRFAAANKGQQDYVSAKERAAEANLATLELRRAARAAAEQLSLATEVVDQVRLIHRGLDTTRQDMHAILRALSFESHLER